MKCPRDNSGMGALPNRSNAYSCLKCNGVFISDPDAMKLVAEHGVNTKNISGGSSKAFLVCKSCDHEMENMVVNKIEIDLCKKCSSLWFDKSELEKVLEYLASDKKVIVHVGSSVEDFGILGEYFTPIDDKPFQWLDDLKDLLGRLFSKK